jgi:hypothetical protein
MIHFSSKTSNNKGEVASEIRELLENMVKVGDLSIKFNNKTDGDMYFRLDKVNVGRYRLVLLNEREDGAFKLQEMRLDMSIRV